MILPAVQGRHHGIGVQLLSQLHTSAWRSESGPDKSAPRTSRPCKSAAGRWPVRPTGRSSTSERMPLLRQRIHQCPCAARGLRYFSSRYSYPPNFGSGFSTSAQHALLALQQPQPHVGGAPRLPEMQIRSFCLRSAARHDPLLGGMPCRRQAQQPAPSPKPSCRLPPGRSPAPSQAQANTLVEAPATPRPRIFGRHAQRHHQLFEGRAFIARMSLAPTVTVL